MTLRFLAAAACAFSLASCNPQPARTAASPSPSSSGAALPPLNVTGSGTRGHPAYIAAQNGNRKVYQVLADSYTSHSVQSAAEATFNMPTVTFYAKDGTKMTARSPTAAVRGGKEVVLSGGVRAVTSTGLTLTCDELTYDQKTEMLHGRGRVRITGMQGGAQQVLTGNQFTSDVKLTDMVIR